MPLVVRQSDDPGVVHADGFDRPAGGVIVSAMRWTPPRPPWTDILVAGALLTAAVAEALTSTDLHFTILEMLVAAATVVPIAWRRVWPLGVIAVVMFVVATSSLVSHSFESGYVFFAMIVGCYSVAANAKLSDAVVGAAMVATFVLVGFAIDPRRGGVGDFLFTGVLFAGAWILGYLIRMRGQETQILKEQAAELERRRAEDAQRAVLAERTRIARELHDVIAHSLSVMVVQTGVVRRRLRHERPSDSELLDEVEQAGRGAIGELRRLLGILRADGEVLALDPQPGLDRLPPLLDQMRETGLTVEVTVEGAPSTLPPGVDLAAYRIVQEALTNTLRHAGQGARAELAIRWNGEAVELEVRDDGKGTAPLGPGTGHGLIGMRERATLYDGRLEAGPREGGGFRVHALLPFAGSER
ncbi:sensor histidine kinase [Micromonospora soli]|uniref:sensor histidine kinase n=1 Tax=Micromonospora sp. NBRC 110009 TaxID=3061627 RepID=UPI0026729E4F|nr:sensor histidine kinase [Micromonospora sp. NBRC 110009]WKT96907.1 sensor histidine kinase [Micromonospora sp. NBRC 110009]